jgi:hypothetical protein
LRTNRPHKPITAWQPVFQAIFILPKSAKAANKGLGRTKSNSAHTRPHKDFLKGDFLSHTHPPPAKPKGPDRTKSPRPSISTDNQPIRTNPEAIFIVSADYRSDLILCNIYCFIMILL